MKTFSIASIVLSSLGLLGSFMLIFAPASTQDVQDGVIALLAFGFYLVFSILVYKKSKEW